MFSFKFPHASHWDSSINTSVRNLRRLQSFWWNDFKFGSFWGLNEKKRRLNGTISWWNVRQGLLRRLNLKWKFPPYNYTKCHQAAIQLKEFDGMRNGNGSFSTEQSRMLWLHSEAAKVLKGFLSTETIHLTQNFFQRTLFI